MLLSAFEIRKNSRVYIIGGGGKTTLMYALARSLKKQNSSVITTTSTKIFKPEEDDTDAVMVDLDITAIARKIGLIEKKPFLVTVAQGVTADARKLIGFEANELDSLHDSHLADYLLVEADGSAGRSIKGHADYEPVVSKLAELVIVVIGIDCLGKPVNDQYVHRPEIFSELTGTEPESPVTVENVATILFHKQGYLKSVGRNSRIAVCLSKVKTDENRKAAGELAVAIRRADVDSRLEQIVTGDLKCSPERIDNL